MKSTTKTKTVASTNGTKPHDQPPIAPITSSPEQASLKTAWLNAMRSKGYNLKLNLLEDMIEYDGGRLDDITRSQIYLDMADSGVPRGYVDHVIDVLAAEHSYHPIKDYLNGLKWDDQDHLINLLGHIKSDGKTLSYAVGKETPLHWSLITRWLLGCVARALDGDKEVAVKHQTPVLTFIGNQGEGKSTLVRWLVSGVGYQYHRESSLDPHSVEHIRSAVTKWIWEVSEMGSSLRKGDRDSFKAFITQEWHTYRKPWGRASITKPTLCNLVGTINPETGFLDDPTGHRRFLPVSITGIDRKYADAVDVNQLWAQIVHLYKNGTSPELTRQEREALAIVHKEHEIENPLQTYIQMYFDLAPGNEDFKCFTAEILQRLQQFGVALKSDAKVAGREINDALAPMGLNRKKLSIEGIKAMGWTGIKPNKVKPPTKGQTVVVVGANQPPATDDNGFPLADSPDLSNLDEPYKPTYGDDLMEL